MKLGIQMSLWTGRPVAAEHGWVLGELAGLGYVAAELHVYGMNDGEMEAWAEAGRGAGVELVPSVVMRRGEADAASEDAGERRGAVNAIRRGVDAAVVFGSGVVVGPMFQAVGRFSGMAASERELGWVAEVLGEGADIAGGAGVELAVEPLNRFESYVANTLEQGAAILDRAGRGNLRLLADTFHANIEERDVTGAFAAHVGRIGCVHISENHRGVPGEGHGTGRGVFEALRCAGYDGLLTIEAFTNKHRGLNERLRIWRPLFEGDELGLAERGAVYIRRCWEGAGG